MAVVVRRDTVRTKESVQQEEPGGAKKSTTTTKRKEMGENRQ